MAQPSSKIAEAFRGREQGREGDAKLRGDSVSSKSSLDPLTCADTEASAQSQLVAQAKSLQQQVSGVSLDEEAIRLVQLQSSYQAASKVVTVIDQLTQSLMNMVP